MSDNNVDAYDVKIDIRRKEMMYSINQKEFSTLSQAMEFAKELNEFVIIKGDNIEIVGIFGVDEVKNGKCPNGIDYTWKKRRK